MDLFNILNLTGGLCLFLFGMTFMGQALERRAGNGLKVLLGRLTTNRFAGLATGLGVTAVIQSSSATTVTVSKWFRDFIDRNGLPKVHIHSLRHTNASILIANGVDIKTVSKRLGHSNILVVLFLYDFLL